MKSGSDSVCCLVNCFIFSSLVRTIVAVSYFRIGLHWILQAMFKKKNAVNSKGYSELLWDSQFKIKFFFPPTLNNKMKAKIHCFYELFNMAVKAFSKVFKCGDSSTECSQNYLTSLPAQIWQKLCRKNNQIWVVPKLT